MLKHEIKSDLARLPYPIALTTHRLQISLNKPTDVVRTLGRLKDCIESTTKYCVAWLLAEYFERDICNLETSGTLLPYLVRPSLGHWFTLLEELSRILVRDKAGIHPLVPFFMKPTPLVPAKPVLKLFRKTAASKLGEHPEFGKFAQYFLGHSPRTVADKHYVRPSEEHFDRAISWLCQQFFN